MKEFGWTVLLLISGGLLVRGLPDHVARREFHLVDLERTWAEAQRYCREEFTDLASLQSYDDVTAALQLMGLRTSWIGLFNGTWKWSLAGGHGGHGDPAGGWFTRWDLFQPATSGKCGTINKSGKWSSKDCEDLFYSVCYNAANSSHILVKEARTWSEALDHCRRTYTDLSSIGNQKENDRVAALTSAGLSVAGSASAAASQLAWTGLHRPAWSWSDGTESSYRLWSVVQSSGRDDCVTMNSFFQSWKWKPCDGKYSFLCQKDFIAATKRSVKVRVKAGSADLSDPAVQDSLLQQLREKMEVQEGTDVRLRWRTQADGRVFHKEDETAPPGGCPKDDVCATV